jgi:two-component system, NtrC family, response regulator GlrR
MVTSSMMSTLQSPGQSRGRILLVDDDPGLLRLLSIRLRTEAYDVEAVESAEEALGALPVFRPDLVITDLRMDKMDGIGLLKEIQRQRPGLCVLLLTAHGTIPDAVEATQSGAFGFLTKPVDKQQLLEHVERAMRVTGARKSDEEWSSEIVTRSPAMEACLQQARMVAGTDARVLITGESGTGKELLARAIHRASARRDGPFVAINCSAMAENLLESELFGHEKGAFTGAHRAHKGLFQAAEGGTILLDEIGDMPVRLQVKLLRVLQEQQIRPVGATEAVSVNARVISATNQDLNDKMIAGTFREDLFYRLNVFSIFAPPLRERKPDIMLLADHFLEKYSAEHNKSIKRISTPAIDMLTSYHWPGNVRELENTIERAVLVADGHVIHGHHLPPTLQTAEASDTGSRVTLTDAVEALERDLIVDALKSSRGNQARAAKLLATTERIFNYKVRKYGINAGRFRL